MSKSLFFVIFPRMLVEIVPIGELREAYTAFKRISLRIRMVCVSLPVSLQRFLLFKLAMAGAAAKRAQSITGRVRLQHVLSQIRRIRELHLAKSTLFLLLFAMRPAVNLQIPPLSECSTAL